MTRIRQYKEWLILFVSYPLHLPYKTFQQLSCHFYYGNDYSRQKLNNKFSLPLEIDPFRISHLFQNDSY